MARETATFLYRNPVFSLSEATDALTPSRRRAAIERLRYAASTGRVKLVTREVYAAIPPGTDPKRFQPDRFLVAAAVRRDAVFCYHAALELLGAAHSDWNRCAVFTAVRRKTLSVGGVVIEFLEPPIPFRSARRRELGVTKVDRLGKALRVTGRERTLLDGLRQPARMGGLPELLDSTAGFGVLDLDLLEALLKAYGEKSLWAAAGWFLEHYQRTFFVPDALLARLERHRPDWRTYLVRGRRGGSLAGRWNLIVPDEVSRLREPDEP
jgi:predicted transcriptional regulator of viral defense system